MPGKQKVTFYLSDELHRQFKIRAAVDGETMSSMAQRAIEFYMNNAELVESSDHVHGNTYRVHNCPECNVAVTIQEDGLALVAAHGTSVVDELADLSTISSLGCDADRGSSEGASQESGQESGQGSKSPDEGELITA
ncbi:MAG: hypothetical protein AAF716_22905 [Cyanobacteria bacterium P01_D01_bin.1]